MASSSAQPQPHWSELPLDWGSAYIVAHVYALFQLGFQRVVDSSTADDLVSEAFLRAFLAPLPEGWLSADDLYQRFCGLLCCRVRYRALDAYRRERKFYAGEVSVNPWKQVFNKLRVDELISDLPGRVKSKHYDEEQIRNVLAALLEVQTGKTNQEIAELLNMSIRDVVNILRLLREEAND